MIACAVFCCRQRIRNKTKNGNRIEEFATLRTIVKESLRANCSEEKGREREKKRENLQTRAKMSLFNRQVGWCRRITKEVGEGERKEHFNKQTHHIHCDNEREREREREIYFVALPVSLLDYLPFSILMSFLKHF